MKSKRGQIIDSCLNKLEELSSESDFAYNLFNSIYLEDAKDLCVFYIKLYTDISKSLIVSGGFKNDDITRYRARWKEIIDTLVSDDPIKPPSEVLIYLSKIKVVLDDYYSSVSKEKKSHPISNEIGAFFESYDEWLQLSRYQDLEKFIILYKYTNLAESLQAFHRELKLFAPYSSSHGESTQEQRLVIYFESDNTLKGFLKKLNAIQNIYYESCQLLNINQNENPLRLISTEGNSKYIELAGQILGITFIGNILHSAIGYLHRNYTKEGKLNQIPKKVEAIESVLGIYHQLNEAGIDTKDMKENISKGSVKIAKDLNLLLEKENQVVINHTEYIAGVQNKELPQLGSGKSDLLDSKETVEEKVKKSPKKK